MTEAAIKNLSYKKGAVVVVKNSENKGFFYIVRSGVLQVDSEHNFKDKVLSKFEPGDSFGLVSALTGHRFLVTVFAATDVELIQVPLTRLGVYLKANKEIALKMLTLYSKELKAIHRYFSDANSPDERKIHPSRLYNLAQYLLAMGNEDFARFAYLKYIEWAEYNGEDKSAIEKARSELSQVNSAYDGPVWQGNSITLQPGEIIFLENQLSKFIYLIKSGSVKLFKMVGRRELILDVLEEGELFGEMAIIEETERMASATTETQTELMRFSKETLFDGVGEAILQKIFISLARRIWFSHQRLLILRLPDAELRLYAFLYNLMRDQDIKSQHTGSRNDSYSFKITFENLKKMCGILKMKNEKLEEFIKDNNIQIEAAKITVLKRGKVEDKVTGHRSSTGQIRANLA